MSSLTSSSSSLADSSLALVVPGPLRGQCKARAPLRSKLTSLTFCCLNANSVYGRGRHIMSFFINNNFTILALQEPMLRFNFLPRGFPTNVTLFIPHTTSGIRGLMWVFAESWRDSVSLTDLPCSPYMHWIALHTKSTIIYLCNIYLPPNCEDKEDVTRTVFTLVSTVHTSRTPWINQHAQPTTPFKVLSTTVEAQHGVSTISNPKED